MKAKLFLILLNTCLLLSPGVSRLIPLQPGIQPYQTVPQNIAKNVYVRIKYYTRVSVTLEYSFIVYDPLDQEVYREEITSLSLGRFGSGEMVYRDQSRYTKVACNLVEFTYKTNLQTTWTTHYSYFYGYEERQILNFNDIDQAFSLINEEHTFIFNSTATNSYFLRSHLDKSNITGRLYFPHDLYFDFRELYFKISGGYDGPLYTEAVLYFEEASLFPLLSNVRNNAALKLVMVKDGDYFRFHAFRDLYVDPLTHLMSAYYRPGFLLTPHLFFPKSRYGLVGGAKGRVEIEHFSFHEFMAVYNFTIDIGRPYIGESGEHEIIIKRGRYVV